MVRMINALVLIGLAVAAPIGAPDGAEAATPPKEPFTVAHSIEMTVLVDPDAVHAGFFPQEIKRSPDGRHFFIVTRKGNLETGANEYRLLLYDLEVVRRGLDEPPLPESVLLASFASTSNRPGIGRATWLSDSRTIGFLAENPGETAQLHTVDIVTRATRKLTSHPTAVVDFDLNVDADRFIYAAVTPADWSDRIARGYVVETETLSEVMGKGRFQQPIPIAYYVGGKAQSPPRPVQLPAYKIGSEAYPWGLSLSPDGRHAVASQYVPDAPTVWWTQYEPVAKIDYLKGVKESAHFTKSNPSIFLQYMLIDLETRTARPLLDAPSALLFGGFDTSAHWLADGRSVILSNTFLPLADVAEDELARRRASSATVEFEIASGRISRIADLAGAKAGERSGFMGSSLSADGRLSIGWMSGSSTTYEERDGQWVEVETATERERLSIAVTQGMNQPPEILVIDPATQQSKVITDLNPQFRDLAMGSVETIEYTVDGKKIIGGLLKPTNYEPGKRYALVIQLHGYDPNEYLIDGPSGSTAGYAARALANRGMMVVQLMNVPTGKAGFPGEIEPQIASYAALIDKLDSEGLIDRARVGIHAHSRTGYYVQHALIFSDLKFAAASVSDPSQLSAYKYATFFGAAYPGMLEDERMIGVPLWGEENARIWAERDPMFNLHRLRTPLRIELYQYGLGWWDVFAILRRHKRPVEYLSFPDAVHVPVKPWERFTSQEGNVDWYDFWLNGHEDPDPVKAEQYARWRQMRADSARATDEQAP